MVKESNFHYIKLLADEQLLEQYTANAQCAGDDFSIHPYTHEDELESAALLDEILARMKVGR